MSAVSEAAKSHKRMFDRERYYANREARKEYQRRYYRANREEILRKKRDNGLLTYGESNERRKDFRINPEARPVTSPTE